MDPSIIIPVSFVILGGHAITFVYVQQVLLPRARYVRFLIKKVLLVQAILKALVLLYLGSIGILGTSTSLGTMHGNILNDPGQFMFREHIETPFLEKVILLLFSPLLALGQGWFYAGLLGLDALVWYYLRGHFTSRLVFVNQDVLGVFG